ncbi:MAG: response regulator [bacterium]|nr:response regulator [bacterium]
MLQIDSWGTKMGLQMAVEEYQMGVEERTEQVVISTDFAGRVLVVDDENGPRQALRMLLNEDYEVLMAENVASAEEILQDTPIDLVITDIRMPKKTGVDLLQWTKTSFPETEVIILTGYSDLNTAMKAVEYGAFAYLEKPFDSTVLRQYVEQGLTKRKRELERRQLEHLALQANRFETLGQFVSGMLHDLGTPLAVIGSQVEIIQTRPEREGMNDRLDSIRSQSQLCSEIVRTAMNFLRHKSEEFVILNLNEVAEACIDIGHPILLRSDVTVKRDLDASLPLTEGDFVLVRQAVLNLITNACHAMEERPDPRELHVSTWRDGDYVCLAVGDTGPGIPEALRKQVFETFYSTKGEGGTGLGLVAVKNVMRRHDGDVVLKDNDGRGALFVLRFPIQKTGSR